MIEYDFNRMCGRLVNEFLATQPTPTETWQSQLIDDKPEMMPREILNFSFQWRLPGDDRELAKLTEANLPWAEDHFGERVSGQPLNPPPSEKWWPFAQQSNAGHKSEGEKFSHTYPERMWPKSAGDHWSLHDGYNYGIRFQYGDLEDVVQQLKMEPSTRQAYLPIWFPEDTGAVHGKRVPCTLGYHFLIRRGRLQITYYIRSCDFLRHFRDDVYMAGRLAQWMTNRYNEDCAPMEEIFTGQLIMHIVNFHVFEGDVPKLQQEKQRLDLLHASKLGALF